MPPLTAFTHPSNDETYEVLAPEKYNSKFQSRQSIKFFAAIQ
jgi:hypothetical protein